MKNAKLLIAVCTIMMTDCLLAQVNTEGMRRAEGERGFAIEASVDFGYASGNTDFLTIQPSLRADLRGAGYHTFVIGNFTRGEANDELYQKKGFAHLRYVRSLDSLWALESFGQLEFDDFINLDDRKLAGAGIRLRLAHKRRLMWATGTGGMLEKEHYRKPAEESKTLVRSTNYISLRWQLDKRLQLNAIGYLQLALSELSDFRVLLDSGLTVNFTRAFAFKSNLALRFDNQPVPGIEKHDLQISNGLALAF